MTRDIIGVGKERNATEVYESIYQLASLRGQCLAALSSCDALLTPTAGKHFSLDELEADPVGPNRLLGHYSNYMNLLDMCGLAIPGLIRRQINLASLWLATASKMLVCSQLAHA